MPTQWRTLTDARPLPLLVSELAGLREDRDALAGNREEPAGDLVGGFYAIMLDPHLAGLLELAEQRCVTGKHAELALGGASHHELRGARPDLLLDGHQLDL